MQIVLQIALVFCDPFFLSVGWVFLNKHKLFCDLKFLL